MESQVISMVGFSRIRAFILMVALLPLSGCLFSSSRHVQTRMSTNALQSATLEQLVDQINSSAAKLQTMNATVTIDASSGGEKKGKVTDYRQINGNVLVRKPEMMRMIGRVPVVGNHLFDMVSDGKTFELSIPPQNKFIVGSNKTEKPSAQPLENLRPQHILNALLLKPIDQAAGEIAVLEQSTEMVKDAKTHKDAIQQDYVVVIISKDEKGPYLWRRVVFSREDLMPHEQYLYNHDGQIITYAHYEKFQDFNGTMFPTVVDIQRPVEEYAITLNILKLRLNEPLRDDQFQLAQPAGSKLINLDNPTTHAENQTTVKPQPEKHAQ
jgi:outer membrane lipoprotein-sorting protein